MELDLKPIELPGIEKKRPMIIAGPCSAETEEQVMDTATMLANKGIKKTYPTQNIALKTLKTEKNI